MRTPLVSPLQCMILSTWMVSFFFPPGKVAGEGNVGYEFYREAFYTSLAKHGSIIPGDNDLVKTAVIIDADGRIFPLYIEGNPACLADIRNQLRRFDDASFEATLVGTLEMFFYAPVSEVGKGDIELLDFSKSIEQAKIRLPKAYVHHLFGGSALKAGVISSDTEILPDRIKVPSFSETGPLPATKPANAHFLVAYGDPQGRLRAIYLNGRDLVPLLQTMLKTSDAPALHGILARASYSVAKSGGSGLSRLWPLLLIPVGIVIVLVWAHRKRKNQKVTPTPEEIGPHST